MTTGWYVFCRGGGSIPVRIRECAETLPYNCNITKGDISHPSGYITPKVYHKFRKEFISLHYEVMPYPAGWLAKRANRTLLSWAYVHAASYSISCELCHIQIVIYSFFVKQFFMISHFCNSAFIHYHYHICISYSRKAVSNDKACS